MHILTLLLVVEMLLPRYMNKSVNLRGLPLNEEMELSWYEHFYPSLHTDQCLLLPTLAYAEEIQLDQVYLQEALGLDIYLIELLLNIFDSKSILSYLKADSFIWYYPQLLFFSFQPGQLPAPPPESSETDQCRLWVGNLDHRLTE